MSESGIFKQAVKLAPERRAAYLDEACGANQELRREIEALLSAHDASAPFLRERAATIDQPTISEGPGSLVGPYKLMEQIGEGGMGLVFVAEQQQPVRRKVALKIIKPGMDSRQVIARFEAERQALAMMDHINIAKVHDAGSTDTGRPYFVMELVHGVPITEYCDQNQLSPHERLELFVPVCHAIQHAHQKGIIHRDIKPSNILVTRYDDRPVPKVIDFGVAKAIEQRLTEKTVYTQYGSLVGTFEYMSPEQAELNAFGVDTRSDVYSLGVLLYELLTGTTPLERVRLREAAFAEVVRLIKEEEAPRPSLRLSTSHTLAKVAAARKTEPGQLTRLLRGELDWIVLRCLEKDRTRRYDSASGLARDVERHLKDEPVEARPPSALYRLRKAARRHKVVLTSALLVFAALALGQALALWQAWRALDAERAATVALAHMDEARVAEAQQRDIAVQNQRRAEASRRAEAEQRDRAEEHARRATRLLYAAHMNLARRAWDDADIRRLRDLLEQQRPERSDGPDLRGFEWRYLWRASHSDLLTLQDGAGAAPQFFGGAVAYSGDGKRLARACGDKTIKICDAVTGQVEATLLGHSAQVTSVAFRPDGRRLASGCMDATAKVWDTASGRELFTTSKHAAPVLSVAFSPDGQRLATSGGSVFGGSGDVRVWEADTGREIMNLLKHNASVLLGFLRQDAPAVHAVAFSPDSQRLAGACSDKTVRVWDLAGGGTEVLVLRGHRFGVTGVAFSPDGRRLASSGGLMGQDGEVKIWDAATGHEMLRLAGHAGPVAAVVFSQDGKRLATGSWDRTVKVWDAASGAHLRTFKGHEHWINGVAFSPDGQRLASTSVDFAVKVWDPAVDQEALTLRHATGVNSVAFSPDGKWLASGSGGNDQGTVRVWHSVTSNEVLSLDKHGGNVTGVAFSPDARRLASSSWDGTVRLWDTSNGREVLQLSVKNHQLYCVAFSPDGKRLAAGANYGKVKVWDAATGQERLELKHSIVVKSIAFSPDGSQLAAGAADGLLKIWDAATGAERLSLQMPVGSVHCLAYSPDGRSLACAGAVVTVLDAATGAQKLVLKGGVSCLAFSPDGTRLATASGDSGLTLWDLATGQETLTLKGHAREVNCLAFSPDGRRLASASADTTVRIWDAPDAQVP